MTKAKIISIISLLFAAVFLSSCSSGAGGSYANQESGNSKQSEKSEDNSPRTFTDVLGRAVEVPAEINSVAALGSAGRFITYAGGADKISGVSELEKNAPVDMPFAYVNAEHFSGCASISSGGSGDTFFAEEIVALNPDIIIVFTADAAKIDEISEQTSVPAVGIYADSFLDERFTESLRFLGKLLGTEEQAELCAESVEVWIEELAAFGGSIPDEEKPVVYTGAVGFKGPHGFEGTYSGYPPFMAIGAVNCADETQGSGAFVVDLEQVVVWNPDIIFLNPSNMYLVNEDYADNKAFYNSLSAIQNGKLYPQPSFNYYCTNMEIAIVDSFYAASVIYSGSITEAEFEQKADEIFNVMLGQDYLKTLNSAGLGFSAITLGE